MRKREANLENVVSNVEAGKSAAGTKSMFGTIIPEIGQNPVDAAYWEQLEQRATRIEERKKKRKDRLEQEEPQPAAKIQKVAHPVRWNHKDAVGERGLGVPAGCALVLSKSASKVSDILRRKGFRIFVASPLVAKTKEFLESAWMLSARRKVGHLVVVDNLAFSQHSSSAALACQSRGGMLVEEHAMLTAVSTGNPPNGIQHSSCLKQKCREVFLHTDAAPSIPGLGEVLEVGTNLPGSKLRLASSFAKIQKKSNSTKKVMGREASPNCSFEQ